MANIQCTHVQWHVAKFLLFTNFNDVLRLQCVTWQRIELFHNFFFLFHA